MATDLAAVRSATVKTLQSYVDEGHLPCVAARVQRGDQELLRVDLGFQDWEAREPLRADAIYRVYSNTKTVTAVAALRLIERGVLSLHTPVAEHLPALADLPVLKPQARDIHDTEALRTPLTVWHLLTHTAGFGYGFIEPQRLPDAAYLTGGLNTVEGIDLPLEELVARLAKFPLALQPGSGWCYGFASDVLAHLLERVSGLRFDALLQREVFEPLAMHDSGFALDETQAARLACLCAPRSPRQPLRGDLRQLRPAGAAPLTPPNWLSGGGGLLISMDDLLRFARMLQNGGELDGTRLLTPGSVDLLLRDQLPTEMSLHFALAPVGRIGFSCGLGVRREALPGEPQSTVGEAFWGGLAGSHLWLGQDGLIVIGMTQLMPGFWHPFSHDLHRAAYGMVTTS